MYKKPACQLLLPTEAKNIWIFFLEEKKKKENCTHKKLALQSTNYFFQQTNN